MGKCTLSTLLFISCFYSGQEKLSLEISKGNKTELKDSSDHFHLNRQLTLSTRLTLMKNNDPAQEINYFSPDPRFTTEEEKRDIFISKPFTADLLETYLNILINNKNK